MPTVAFYATLRSSMEPAEAARSGATASNLICRVAEAHYAPLRSLPEASVHQPRQSGTIGGRAEWHDFLRKSDPLPAPRHRRSRQGCQLLMGLVVKWGVDADALAEKISASVARRSTRGSGRRRVLVGSSRSSRSPPASRWRAAFYITK